MAVALLAACAAPGPPPTRIVLVVIDTLRADRLGAYGCTRGLTPFFDELAGRAVVFRNAWATAPYTRPSVASLFTSRFPSQHGVTNFAGLALADDETTLAEALSSQGWRTAAFLGTPVPDRRSGFAQGFALYDEPRQAKRPASILRILTLASLSRLASPTPAFLYLHYLEPHVPWAPSADLLARVRPGLSPADLTRLNGAMMVSNEVAPDAATLADVEAVYDAEVMAVDRELRALFTALERERFLESAVVVITADHGEGFGAHGLFGHANSLYEELIHVPLLVVLPGQSRGRIVDEPVSLVDVAPTLLDLAGIAAPPSFEGRSLRPLLETGPVERVAAWFRSPPPEVSEFPLPPGGARDAARPRHARAIRLGSRKVIRGSDGHDATYDLRNDPDEQRPVDASDARLAPALDEFVARHAAAAPTARRQDVAPETAEHLKALGYVVDD